MSCNTNTNLEGLRKPSKFKALPNAREELYTIAYSHVESEIDRLTNLGWIADKKGKRDLANHYYKGANRYFYLIQLAIIVRNYISSISKVGRSCNSAEAAEKYNLECVETNLNCMSSTYGTDYKKAWFGIMEDFGIDRKSTNCEECCEGIGGMIISAGDECNDFEINNCNN